MYDLGVISGSPSSLICSESDGPITASRGPRSPYRSRPSLSLASGVASPKRTSNVTERPKAAAAEAAGGGVDAAEAVAGGGDASDAVSTTIGFGERATPRSTAVPPAAWRCT